MRRYALLAAVALASPTLAAEGMWLPSQAPKLAAQLKAEGLELPAAALADLNRAPMSAIASLGGCSASFVSPRGLVATNHHCIYGSIQVNSRPGRDLIKNGFLARTLAEELPATPSARVFVIDALDDVTAAMTAGVGQLTGAARDAKLAANRKAIIAACEAKAGNRCDVRSYFGGAQYWRQTMLEIRDVRLVYAPAEGVGNFGGETDNWQWPRHTGDFGFYRAYVGPDGKPAAPSPNNVPYRPKAWLKMATGDLKAGDFVMIAGFPGVTERYRTLAETERWYGDIYPTQQRLLSEYSDLIGREAKTDGERILYANLRKGADNYKKKILGQMDAARKADLVGRKRDEGAALGQWAALPANRATHALAISNYDSLIDQNLAAERGAIVSATLNRAQLLRAARLLYRWANERELADAAREPGYQDRDRQTLVDQLNLIGRQYDPRIDQAVLAQALGEYRKLPADSRNAGLDAALPQDLGTLYAGTKLGDAAERLAWLDRPASAFR